MRIVIIGAGQVGTSIARNLQEDHEVVVIDSNEERVDNLLYSQDVLAIHGDGTSLSTLQEAEVENADVVIASTDDDEINIIACATAKIEGDAFTIARIKKTTYHETWQKASSAFGVDFMVSTSLLAAETVVRVIGIPAAQNVDVFAEGTTLMAEFNVPEDSPLVDQTLAETDQFSELTVVAILRENELTIPEGETSIEAHDKLVVIGTPQSTRAFASDLTPTDSEDTQNIVIIGGSEIGVQIAHLLEERGIQIRLIERNEKRAQQLAEELPKTTVLSSDATNQEFLAREHIGDADIIVAALGSDEKTLLGCLLATNMGVERTVAVVKNAEYSDLFEAVGVNAAINPRDVAAEEIIRFTHSDKTENIAIVDNDRAEVLELKIGSKSVLADRKIKDSMTDLPADVLIGMITRDGECITPRGETTVKVGDHAIVFVKTDIIDEVADLI